MISQCRQVSHQAEELFHEHQHDWVRAQMESTRDAVTSNPFSEWLWGGMQYQLEHHLFPTMPRYRYPALVTKVEALKPAQTLSLTPNVIPIRPYPALVPP